MKLYENVVIGNFLYSLGFSVCSKSERIVQPSMVNLLQQTPADEALSDVLIEFPGTMKLIEFKQVNNKSNKEKEKHRKIAKWLDSHDKFREISRSVHWFIETEPKDENFVSRVVPYLDAYPRSSSQFDLWSFVEQTAKEAVVEKSLFSDEDLKDYLKLIARLNGKDSVGTGGLLVHLSNDGRVRYSELTDMTQMKLSHREYIKNVESSYQGQSLNMSRQRGRDYDRGPSL